MARSISFWIRTWTGRIVILNTLIFLLVSIVSGSLFLPDHQALLLFGAKDSVTLARGEFWRLLTPVFLHIGLIHFSVNTYFLYQVGEEIEQMIGGRWFVAIYILSGVAGNIASAFHSVNLSAGASGALFGLLGTGFFMERAISRKLADIPGRSRQKSAYTVTILINLMIGFLIPFIDNAAHLGGLFSGVILTMAMLMIRKNQIYTWRPVLGKTIFLSFLIILIVAGIMVSNKSFAVNLILNELNETDSLERKFYLIRQALRIDPGDPRLEEFVKQVRGLLHDEPSPF